MDQARKNLERDIPLALVGAAAEPAPASVEPPSGASGLRMNSGPMQISEKEDESNANSTIKLSRRRWLVLLAMCTFGICATISNTTAPILGLILELLDLTVEQYIHFRNIFPYFSLVTSIPIAWYVDKCGIKLSVFTAAALYALSSVLKAALYSTSLPGWRHYRMFCWFVGGFVGAQAASIFFMLPLKVSETWFSAKERSVAWTLMKSTGDFGICLISLIYPRIMQTLPDIRILAYINIVAPIVTSIACLTCISTDGPKHAPSERQARANKLRVVPFKTSMKRIVTNKDVILHLLHNVVFRAATMSVSNIFQRILTNAGHSTIFVGNLMSSSAFVSIIMLILMSSFVHKTENPIRICKLSSALHSVVYIAYLVFLVNQMPGWSLVAMSTVLTVCKSWAVPNSTNITAHLASGLVSQATIVGFSMTLGVLVSNVINVTFALLIEDLEEGGKQVTDFTQPLIFITLVTATNETIYQLFFTAQSRMGEADEPTKNKSDLERNSNKD